jgi:protein SCO1/2
MLKYICLLAILISLFISCDPVREKVTLPILGNRDVTATGDTIYPKVPDFSFTDQDSQIVNNATFEGKAYVVDFFFIHCPTICPKVKAQAKRIYDRFAQEPQLLLLSHTIDTKNDTVPALHAYAGKLGIDSKKWHLVTGDHDAVYGMADDYFSVAVEDQSAPGGFDHSGRLILVDKNRHVRSFCDGTDSEAVTRFMEDIQLLLNEMKKQ